MRRAVGIFSLLTGVCLWAGQVSGADPKDQKPGQEPAKPQPTKPATGHEGHDHGDAGEHADMKPLQIQPEHKILLEGVGKWKMEQKHYMPGTTEPMPSTGTSIVTPILDGLGTSVQVESTGPMGTFKGFGIFTWNTGTKKYEGTWLDIYGYNGMDEFEGTYEAATKTMTWKYSMSMPGGIQIPCKMVEKYESADKISSTFSMCMPGQPDTKMMDVVYTRMK